MKTVKWGIIGVGNVCEVKSAPAMQIIENSELVAVMRRSKEKVKDYAKKHNVDKWYTNAEDLINDPEVNAIYIATPPKFHKEYALKVAKANKPCYIEKPMATTYKDCLDIVKVFEEKDLPLFIAYYRTALPNFLKVKELLENNKLGQILSTHITLTKPLDIPDENYHTRNWRVNQELAGDGYFYDLGSHQLNFLEFLFGNIKSINGTATNNNSLYQTSDLVVCNFEFENGILGQAYWNFNHGTKNRTDEFVIRGTKGMLKMASFNDNAIEIDYLDGTSTAITIPYPKHVQQPLITQIVNDLLNKDNTCYSTGKVGVRTNELLGLISK